MFVNSDVLFLIVLWKLGRAAEALLRVLLTAGNPIAELEICRLLLGSPDGNEFLTLLKNQSLLNLTKSFLSKGFFRENQTQQNQTQPNQNHPRRVSFRPKLSFFFCSCQFFCQQGDSRSCCAACPALQADCPHPRVIPESSQSPISSSLSCSGGGTSVTSHPSPSDHCLHFQLPRGCCSCGEILAIFWVSWPGFPPLWGFVGCVSSSLCSWTQTLLDLNIAGFCSFLPCMLSLLL